ncbi:gliding motility-associated C-terminal domain-containing protein [Pustulibacterium marinum]|uniref:Gliding motility-associated C-terminal domain-containing protein n=1 Tax=Pustulibacterium marinum TaxID=1224947 RepID=A0A1I7FLQ6_9FLAO|nr:choice-of-anchor L domain-containing protein [Pustulibacterium marinum]SFU37110.1 gliding motility-associated C-terminal domain-containing protein [Pustulibacterium marinum]
MKYFLLILLISFSLANAQSITTDANSYTPQELIEDILINSSCIENINVTNAVSGDFGASMKSYGYFNATGTDFPFESGIVMSTGRLDNVPGPNNSLSDDDAANWGSDADLNSILDINNTTNATVLEFDFTPNANTIKFNYIFASEEYQEGNSNTCIYSDVFAFLIKPENGDYTNIAVVPGTNTPVQVTTVHPEIPGGCSAENENYFGSFNNNNVPINFNGQTAVLTAEATVTPNTTYHIKLVIADEQNYRYDSAVFLEAESFDISAELGMDHTIENGNPLCDDETFLLTPEFIQNAQSFSWYLDGNLISGENESSLEIDQAGTYSVQVILESGCIANDEVVIEYAESAAVENTILTQCDDDNDGLTVYNLHNADPAITGNNQNIQITGYYLSLYNAENENYPIANPDAFYNASPGQIVYAAVANQFGCSAIASIELSTVSNEIPTITLTECDDQDNDGFASFSLSDSEQIIATYVSAQFDIHYFESVEDAILYNNELSSTTYINNVANQQTIYARVQTDTGCYGIVSIVLVVNRAPAIGEDQEIIYCENTYPASITLYSGLQGNTSNFEFLWNTGATTPTIHINEAGSYSVEVTNNNGCSATRNFNVLTSSLPNISYDITGNVGNYNVTITAEGSGNYLYSIDEQSFDIENTFFQVSPGEHTIYVTDTNGCGTAEITFYIIDFPNYFTPNNDGVNDTWNVLYNNNYSSAIQYIEIFDRYGKLITILSPQSAGWDGTFNGLKLPSDDYWFSVHLQENIVYRRNFSLKR